MANTNAPYGFKLHSRELDVKHRIKRVVIPASDGTALFIGDPVIKTTTGEASTGLPTAIRATAGATNVVYGIVLGFEYDDTYPHDRHRTASTRRVATVVECASDVLFRVQSAGTITAGDIGARANASAGTGNTFTGLSGFTLDASEGADATYQFQIEGLHNVSGGDIDGAYNEAIVKCNLFQDANATAGV